MKIIYDFGANDGDDIVYFLKKADQVIAVEANPMLADHLGSRFAEQVRDGTLIIVNSVVSDSGAGEMVPFYLHNINHPLSQLPRPAERDMHQFTKVMLPSQRASDIILKFGTPYYVKIDIEGYDHVALKEIFSAGIRPPFISAEAHHLEVFMALVMLGGYRAFKLVEGSQVPQRYGAAVINTSFGQEPYRFSNNSTGPFGDDLHGPWMTENNFFRVLAVQGLGWKDIHATNTIEADPTYIPKLNIDFRYVI